MCSLPPPNQPPPEAAESVTAPAEGITGEFHIGLLEQNSIELSAASAAQFDSSTTAITFTYKDFPSLNALLLELEAGRINAIVNLPDSVCKYLEASNSKVKIGLGLDAYRTDFHMATRTEDSALNKELSDAINSLKADGTMDTLAAEYLGDVAAVPVPIKLAEKEDAKTYKVAITGDLPPMDYIAVDGTPAGFNVALLNAISEKIGCNFEIVQLEAAARLVALKSGNVDFVFWVNCASSDGYESKEEEISLTTPYYNEQVRVVSYSQDLLDEMTRLDPEPKK